MLIRPAERADAADWLRMRQALWPSEDDLAEEVAAYFEGERKHLEEVLLAFDEEGRAIGFAELSIRPYAEGCYSGRVAFLEGWYVDPAMRHRGVGAALVTAAEEWGRSQGCTEMGSDTEIENVGSAAAHQSLGFTEVTRLVCFRKDL
jgi:aminoglycoside 6'-N-acetyltransferase I